MPGILTRQSRMNTEMVSVSTIAKTTTYSMVVGDLHVYANTTAGPWTLTLPPVGESEGLCHTIELTGGSVAGAAPNLLTITHKGDSSRWEGNYTLARPGQRAVLCSDGAKWSVMDSYLGTPVPTSKYIYETWKQPFILGTIAGGGPSATLENIMLCGSGNVFSYIGIVGQTLHPVWANPGVDWAGDQTASDGWEFTTGIGSGNPNQFVVGTDKGFFVRSRFTIADVSGLGDCALGFRKREAYQANLDNYDEMACLNVKAGALNIETILNNATTVTTDTTNTWADTATHTLEVRVSSLGVVTYLYDDVAPTVVAAYTFDSGENVIPFFNMVQAADLSGAVTFLEFECGAL